LFCLYFKRTYIIIANDKIISFINDVDECKRTANATDNDRKWLDAIHYDRDTACLKILSLVKNI